MKDRSGKAKRMLGLAALARARVCPILVLAVVAATAAGCGSGSPRQWRGSPPIIFSPNGEPLSGGRLGKVACRETIGRWFDRADANGDGILTFEEFEADARRQFAAMDTDSDGYVTPPELASVRAPYRPVDSSPTSASLAARQGDRRGERGRSPGSRFTAGQFDDGSIDQADPVMSADTNLDFRVSRAEFLAQARRAYARFDAGADGLARTEAVARTCRDDRDANRDE
jgi:hypothetical protein